MATDTIDAPRDLATPIPDTSSENDQDDQSSKGRATPFVLAAIFSGISAVLMLSYFMTRTSEYGISLKPLFIWEITLFLSAIIAMVTFTRLRQNSSFVVENDKPFSDAYMDFLFDSWRKSDLPEECKDKLPFWTYIPLRAIGLCVCCIVAILLPIYDIYRSLANMQCFENRQVSFRLLNCGRQYCSVLFCLCQTVFLLRFKTRCTKNSLLRLFMSTIIAANFTMLVNVGLNIKLAGETVNLKTKVGSGLDASVLEEKLMFVSCHNNKAKIDYIAEWIYKFSYQFPIEFFVLSLCYLWTIYNPTIPGVSKPRRNTDRSMTSTLGAYREHLNNANILFSASNETTRHKLCRKIILAINGTIAFTSRWTFILSFLLIGGIFTLILYNEIEYMTFIEDTNILLYNRTSNSTHMKNYYAIIQTIYHYSFCIIVPFAWLLAARKEKIAFKKLNPSDGLLLIATAGHIVFVMFETVDFAEVVFDKRSDTIAVIFFIKMLLKYQGLLGEAVMVLIASKMDIRQDSIKRGRQLVIRILIVFLGVFNMERWFTDNFLPPNVIRYVEVINFKQMYGEKTWWFLIAYLYPFVVIFRVAMVTMCFEICVRIKRETLKFQHNNLEHERDFILELSVGNDDLTRLE